MGKKVPLVQGEKFVATLMTITQDRIDADAVRATLTPEQLREVVRTIEMEQMRVKAILPEKTKFVAPSFANATPGGLADMLGDVKEQIKVLEKMEGLIKEALKARWPEEPLSTDDSNLDR